MVFIFFTFVVCLFGWLGFFVCLLVVLGLLFLGFFVVVFVLFFGVFAFQSLCLFVCLWSWFFVEASTEIRTQ